MTAGYAVGSGRPTIAGRPAYGVGSGNGPTSPCKRFACIAGHKAGAEVDVRLTGDTRVHGTVGVHTHYICCVQVKVCVRGVRTTQQYFRRGIYTTLWITRLNPVSTNYLSVVPRSILIGLLKSALWSEMSLNSRQPSGADRYCGSTGRIWHDGFRRTFEGLKLVESVPVLAGFRILDEQ